MQIMIASQNNQVFEKIESALKAFGHVVKQISSEINIFNVNTPDLIVSLDSESHILDKIFSSTKEVKINSTLPESKMVNVVLKSIQDLNLNNSSKIESNEYSKAGSLEELEKIHIKKVLEETSTFEEAANVLGINMSTLWRKRKAYSI